ncbi:MAG: hypothetical protein DRP63_02890 [Planctomycetota bacterium]|nr:MAG: hypothetical protein DRP63_02890 [Planctomycetota bacterium]
MWELTARAVVIGAVLTALMCAANTYLGFRVGMTVCASISTAVASMTVLRGLLCTGTVRKNNLHICFKEGERRCGRRMSLSTLLNVWMV